MAVILIPAPSSHGSSSSTAGEQLFGTPHRCKCAKQNKQTDSFFRDEKMTQSNISNGKAKFLLLSAAMFLNVACATEPNKGLSKSAPLTQTYTWFDGEREQKVWVNPNIVAEFNPDQKGEISVKSASATARVLPTKHKQSAIRLWQIDNAADAATRSLKASHPQGRYSPVMHDGPGSGGRMRALPGNIIVYLDPLWNEATVSNWLNTRHLEVVKKLEIGPNIYVIKTGSGLDALNAANALYRSGEVKAAFPDWWQEVTTR
jgi:hypothetical protein